MSRGLHIVPLSRSSRDVSRFLKLSYSIYERDRYWVAPLLADLKKVFTDANPLFDHAEMQLWIARQDGRDAGRIAGILDHHYTVKMGQATAFFGFYECVEDMAVSRALFAAVFEWAQSKGAAGMLGPMNPTTNDECGLLLEGFDAPPAFMMTYNPRYYPAQVDAAGFRKAKDLVAFHIPLATLPMARLVRISEKLKQRNPALTFRPVLRKTLKRDLAALKQVYNDAWQDNWGFVPMTDAEMDFMAARLKPLLFEGLVWLAETHNQPVGFLLALPDYNPALQPLRGRLLTPKLFQFLPYLFGWRCPKWARVITLGVTAAYRNKGIESALLVEGLKVGYDSGMTDAEASWILEDNVMMCRVIEAIGGRIYKRYRLYERGLQDPTPGAIAPTPAP